MGARNDEVESLLFKVAFVIYVMSVFFNALHKSAFSFLPMNMIINVMRITAALIAYFIYFRKCSISLKFFVAIIFMVALPLIFRSLYSSAIFVVWGLVLAAKDRKLDEWVDMCIVYLIIALSVAFLFSSLGIIPNDVKLRTVPFFGTWRSYYWGFHYYSTPAYYGMSLGILILYKNRDRCSYALLLKLLGLAAFVFVMTFTRLQFIVNCLVLFLYLVVYKLKILTLEGKIWKYYSIVAYPLMTLIVVGYSFVAIFMMTDNFEELNEISGSRMAMNVQAFMNYDLNMWGNQIEIKTRDMGKDESYFYIDSGYVSAILTYGLVFYSFLMCCYGILMYRAWKLKCKFVYIVFLVFSVANLMNNFLMNLVTFPFLLLLTCDFEAIAPKREILKMKLLELIKGNRYRLIKS